MREFVSRARFGGDFPQPKYPECERLREIHTERHAITEFVEWAGQRIGSEPLDYLIMEFYNIDPDLLEAERRAMLEEERQ